jgi:cation diffusion facilitator CzcD-associated flavoprotein CzcO
VAVIGSGSSAIQIVPGIQKSVKQLDNYVRGKTWIATPFAPNFIYSRGADANC